MNDVTIIFLIFFLVIFTRIIAWFIMQSKIKKEQEEQKRKKQEEERKKEEELKCEIKILKMIFKMFYLYFILKIRNQMYKFFVEKQLLVTSFLGFIGFFFIFQFILDFNILESIMYSLGILIIFVLIYKLLKDQFIFDDTKKYGRSIVKTLKKIKRGSKDKVSTAEDQIKQNVKTLKKIKRGSKDKVSTAEDQIKQNRKKNITELSLLQKQYRLKTKIAQDFLKERAEEEGEEAKKLENEIEKKAVTSVKSADPKSKEPDDAKPEEKKSKLDQNKNPEKSPVTKKKLQNQPDELLEKYYSLPKPMNKKLLNEYYEQKSRDFQKLSIESRKDVISNLYDATIEKLEKAEEIRKNIQENDQNYESDDEIKEIVDGDEDIQNAINDYEEGKQDSIDFYNVEQNKGIGFRDLLEDLEGADEEISENLFGPLNKYYNENLKN